MGERLVAQPPEDLVTIGRGQDILKCVLGPPRGAIGRDCEQVEVMVA